MSASLFFLALSLLLSSCLPQISLKAGSNDDAVVFFSTGFSQATAKTLQSINGADTNAPLFNKADVLSLLISAGAVETSVSLPSATEITATGTIPHLATHQISQAGIIAKNAHSLTLTLGPNQISAFYDLLNDDVKSYLDLLMIPALIGEKMSVAEYTDLLASMYGPTFADEIVSGKLTIQLASPDGRKKLRETVTLGELLTMQTERTWSVNF